MTIIEILGIYGACLSSILAFFKILEFWKDRINVQVRVSGNFRIEHPDHPLNPFGDHSLVRIEICNKGRRPVTITHAGFIMPTTKERMIPEKYLNDIKLNENE